MAIGSTLRRLVDFIVGRYVVKSPKLNYILPPRCPPGHHHIYSQSSIHSHLLISYFRNSRITPRDKEILFDGCQKADLRSAKARFVYQVKDVTVYLREDVYMRSDEASHTNKEHCIRWRLRIMNLGVFCFPSKPLASGLYIRSAFRPNPATHIRKLRRFSLL